MERQSEVSSVSRTRGREDVFDSLNMRDELGRTFQNVVASDSKKYLKEVLVLGATDFEHGAWEDHHDDVEHSREGVAELQNSLNGSGENVGVDSLGDTIGAGSESVRLRYTHRSEVSDTAETKPQISGELLFRGGICGATSTRLEDTTPGDEIEFGVCLSPTPGELDGKENVRRLSCGARMLVVTKPKGVGSYSNETAEKRGEQVQREMVGLNLRGSGVVSEGTQGGSVIAEAERAISPPCMPDYIMANEAGGTGERNIRLVRAKGGAKGVCDSVPEGDGFSSVVELGINETRRRLIKKLAQDIELLEKEIQEKARRWNIRERKWLDYVDLKLNDLEVMRTKRLTVEEKCAETTKERVLLSGENTFGIREVADLEERKWNKYVEKELDDVVALKQSKDVENATEVQAKTYGEQMNEETREMHSDTSSQDRLASQPHVQTSGTHEHEQKTSPGSGILKEDVDEKSKASGHNLDGSSDILSFLDDATQNTLSTDDTTRRLKITGTPILQSIACGTDIERFKTPDEERTPRQEKKRVTFSL